MLNPANDRSEILSTVGLAAVFAAMALLVTVDLVFDLRGGTSAGHALLEGAVIAIGAAGAGWLTIRVRNLAREAHGLRDRAHALAADLDASREEASRWRRDAGDLIAGLGAAIDHQLERWQLSPAEKEIALLLLKGLSHKEVAEIRGVSAPTVRQQARAIYRKAGLGGRHDLAAFFLEDLLGPQHGG